MKKSNLQLHKEAMAKIVGKKVVDKKGSFIKPVLKVGLPEVVITRSMKVYFVTCPNCGAIEQITEDQIKKSKGVTTCEANVRLRKCGCKFKAIIRRNRDEEIKALATMLRNTNISWEGIANYIISANDGR